MSVMVGVGKAAEAGVLIRNGEALQTASRITAMVLDKTGTITEGSPAVTDVIALDDFAEEEILQWAASLESGSEHPLAQAIVESAKAKGAACQRLVTFRPSPVTAFPEGSMAGVFCWGMRSYAGSPD